MPLDLRKTAAFLGASGVALGAFGAHGLKNTLTQRGSLDNWRTATMYQLFHATTLLVMSTIPEHKTESKTVNRAGKLIAAGTLMFSGSIYGLCLGVGPKKLLGPSTPLGGLLLIGGWVLLGFS